MHHLLEACNYLAVPGFVSKERAQALAQGLSAAQRHHPMDADTQVAGAPAVYNHLPLVRLLVESIPKIQDVCEERLLPTYAYARIYQQGSYLAPHMDRDACELSVTVNLDADCRWPIWIRQPSGQAVALEMAPGDAVIYLGCDTEHWREPYNGSQCCQAFLHYVFSYGKRSYAYFDKARLPTTAA